MRKLLLTAGFALLALAGTATAATNQRAHRPGLDCRDVQTMTTQWLCEAQMAGHPAKKKPLRCKPGYHRKTVWVRRHHKRFRRVRCVRVKSKTGPVATAAPPTLTAPTTVRAGIDPSYTQDPSDNLKVTWDYSASSATSPLPAGTLSLTVQEPNKTGSSGGCTMNVGGSVTGGTCTQELPHYGLWNVTVSYTTSDASVSPSSQTDTEDIEPLPVPPPPPPAPITVAKAWGTDAPSNRPTVSATVIGSTADVTVTDANYEGAASVTVSDQNGDSCTATISGTTASCQMALGPNVTPSTFQVSYPGGASTQSTDPDGAAVTTTWPAQSIAVANPTVTVQQATVEQCGGSQQGGPWNSQTGCSYQNPNAWSNPVETTVNRQVQLDAVAFGSLASDRDPTHGDGQVSGFLTFTVTGGAEGTDYTASDFQNGPDNSVDCSKVTTQSFDAGTGTYGPDEPTGTCALKFLTAGTYTVTVSYTSEDANYASVQNVDSETIDVLP